MKLLYIVNARIPTEKAHGFQIAKMCESFAGAGATVELVIPRRRNSIATDLFTYYGLRRNFTITTLVVPDTIRWGPIGYYVHTLLFAMVATVYAMRRSVDIVYSRDLVPLFLTSFFKATALEVHNVPSRALWLYRVALRRIPRIISTNKWKRNFLIESCSVMPNRIAVQSNAVDVTAFLQHASREALCHELGLATEFTYVVYTGHLYDWKGAHILAQSAALLPDTIRILFVGGIDDDVRAFQARYDYPQLIFVGMQARERIPKYLAIAAVLIVPNIPSTRESIHATSPMKLFEYMASGRPIIASDLPSIREIVDDSCVFFVEPAHAAALADVIKFVVKTPQEAAARSRNAQARVASHTWEHRAREILKFI